MGRPRKYDDPGEALKRAREKYQKRCAASGRQRMQVTLSGDVNDKLQWLMKHYGYKSRQRSECIEYLIEEMCEIVTTSKTQAKKKK